MLHTNRSACISKCMLHSLIPQRRKPTLEPKRQLSSRAPFHIPHFDIFVSTESPSVTVLSGNMPKLVNRFTKLTFRIACIETTRMSSTDGTAQSLLFSPPISVLPHEGTHGQCCTNLAPGRVVFDPSRPMSVKVELKAQYFLRPAWVSICDEPSAKERLFQSTHDSLA